MSPNRLRSGSKFRQIMVAQPIALEPVLDPKLQPFVVDTFHLQRREKSFPNEQIAALTKDRQKSIERLRIGFDRRSLLQWLFDPIYAVGLRR